LLVALLAVSSGLVLAPVGAAAAGRADPPGDRDANHCVNEFGVDYNELYDVADQFRVFECRVISAGEHWIPWLPWVTHDFGAHLYPEGYVPSEPEPIDDFLSKLEWIKVVVDGGTRNEKIFLFDPDDVVRTDITADQIFPGLFPPPFPAASMLPVMPPLSVGEHTHEPILVLSKAHCDGFGTDPFLQCLPEGETSFGVRPLSITKPE
jgi:hypothetical protein